MLTTRMNVWPILIMQQHIISSHSASICMHHDCAIWINICPVCRVVIIYHIYALLQQVWIIFVPHLGNTFSVIQSFLFVNCFLGFACIMSVFRVVFFFLGYTIIWVALVIRTYKRICSFASCETTSDNSCCITQCPCNCFTSLHTMGFCIFIC